jgi:hypothetical protein
MVTNVVSSDYKTAILAIETQTSVLNVPNARVASALPLGLPHPRIGVFANIPRRAFTG